jgi:hypothetical protein
MDPIYEQTTKIPVEQNKSSGTPSYAEKCLQEIIAAKSQNLRWNDAAKTVSLKLEMELSPANLVDLLSNNMQITLQV